MKIQSRTRRVYRFVKITEHKCRWCGQWFETIRSNAQYCPQRLRLCRVEAFQKRRG